MKTQRAKKQILNIGLDHRSKNKLGKKQESAKKNPQSGTSSLFDAPQSCPDPVPTHFIIEDRSALYASRDGRREQALFYCSLVDLKLSSVSRYHIQAGAPLCSDIKPKAFGIPWVSVHGIDSICVAVRRKDMRRLRQALSPCERKNSDIFRSRFWNTIISEVEDIAVPSGESRQLLNKSSKKPCGSGLSGKPCQMLDKCSNSPFGVVSVIKGTTEDPKASVDEYDAEKANKFLLDEMESGAVFTFDKTTQTTIFALWHLFRQEIEADDIRAFVLKNDEPIGRELKQIRVDSDIEEFLAIINGA